MISQNLFLGYHLFYIVIFSLCFYYHISGAIFFEIHPHKKLSPTPNNTVKIHNGSSTLSIPAFNPIKIGAAIAAANVAPLAFAKSLAKVSLIFLFSFGLELILLSSVFSIIALSLNFFPRFSPQ